MIILKIKAVILTAALIASASVGAAAYAAIDQARTHAPKVQDTLCVPTDTLPSLSREGTDAPSTSAEGPAESLLPAEEPLTQASSVRTDPFPTDVTEPTGTAALTGTGQTELPASVPEGDACMLALRGGVLYVTTLASFGGDVVYAREVPAGKQFSPGDGARLSAGIIFDCRDSAIRAVWDLLT